MKRIIILTILLLSIASSSYSQLSVTTTARTGKKVEIKIKNNANYDILVHNESADGLPCFYFEMFDNSGNLINHYHTSMNAKKYYILKSGEEEKKTFSIKDLTKNISLVKEVNIRFFLNYTILDGSRKIESYRTPAIISLIE